MATARPMVLGVPMIAPAALTACQRGGPMNLTDDQVRAVAGYVHSSSRATG